MSNEERELIERMYRRMLMMHVKESSFNDSRRQMCPSGIIALSGNNFNSSIRECFASVIDFYADWCIPCKIMDPILNSYRRYLQVRCSLGVLMLMSTRK